MLNAIDARRGPGGIFAGHIDHDDPNKTIIPGAPQPSPMTSDASHPHTHALGLGVRAARARRAGYVSSGAQDTRD